MERVERVRSAEDEAELDRKIAQIREKNEKIQKRAQEIEADRLQAGGTAKNSVDKKTEKTQTNSTSGVKTGKGSQSTTRSAWDREWDKGKTPAEQWRENVPSMELTDRRRQDGGGGRKKSDNSTRIQEKPRNTQRSDNPVPNVGARLAGRVSFDKERNTGDQSKQQPRQQNGRKFDQPPKKQNGDLRIEIKSLDQDRRRRGRNSQKSTSSDQPSQEKNNNEQKSRPARQRRGSDNYAVKNVLFQLVNRVVKEERRSERLLNNNELIKDKEAITEEIPKNPENTENLLKETSPNESNPSVETSKDTSPGSEHTDGGSRLEETKLSLISEKILRPPQIIA